METILVQFYAMCTNLLPNTNISSININCTFFDVLQTVVSEVQDETSAQLTFQISFFTDILKFIMVKRTCFSADPEGKLID